MTALTTTEFNNLFNTALSTFAELSEEEMEAEFYGFLKPSLATKADKLWLYVYALNTWDNTDGASNYLTEAQMLGLISLIQNNGL
jgi:hypothetical protein